MHENMQVWVKVDSVSMFSKDTLLSFSVLSQIERIGYDPKEIILQSLRYYPAFKLSYHEIEEIFAERNIHFNHSTLSRGVIKYKLFFGLKTPTLMYVNLALL